MGLGCQIVNLCRLDLSHQTHQITGICGVCIVQEKGFSMIRRGQKGIDPCGIGNTMSTDQSMDLISFFQ